MLYQISVYGIISYSVVAVLLLTAYDVFVDKIKNSHTEKEKNLYSKARHTVKAAMLIYFVLTPLLFGAVSWYYIIYLPLACGVYLWLFDAVWNWSHNKSFWYCGDGRGTMTEDMCVWLSMKLGGYWENWYWAFKTVAVILAILFAAIGGYVIEHFNLA